MAVWCEARADLGRIEAAPAGAPVLAFDLDAAIAEAMRQRGAGAVVDLLVSALTAPSVASDVEIDRHLEAFKSACRQSRRYRDAIPVLKRIAELNPARRPEIAVELALVQAHLGRPAKALAMVERAVAGQRRLPAARRSLAFCVVAEIAATVLRQPELAREIAELGRTAGQSVAASAPVSIAPEAPVIATVGQVFAAAPTLAVDSTSGSTPTPARRVSAKRDAAPRPPRLALVPRAIAA